MKKKLMFLLAVVFLLGASSAYAAVVSVSATGTGDNEFWTWSNGGIGDWNQNNWGPAGTNWQIPQTMSDNVIAGQPVDLYIAVRNYYNIGSQTFPTNNPAGFLASILAGTGTFVNPNSNTLLTDTTHWQVATTGAWNDAATLASAAGNSIAAFNLLNWGAPTSYGANGVSPWGLIAGIDTNAEWLWTSRNSGTFDSMDNYAIFHTTFTAAPQVTPEPISSTLFLLGGGALVAGRLRKKNRKS